MKRLATKCRSHPAAVVTPSARLAAAKAEAGVLSKRMINEGRAAWLMNQQLADGCGEGPRQAAWQNVSLLRYVDESVSPENVLLTAYAR